MTVGWVGATGIHYDFVIMESLAPRIDVPQAVCVLDA